MQTHEKQYTGAQFAKEISQPLSSDISMHYTPTPEQCKKTFDPMYSEYEQEQILSTALFGSSAITMTIAWPEDFLLEEG